MWYKRSSPGLRRSYVPPGGGAGRLTLQCDGRPWVFQRGDFMSTETTATAASVDYSYPTAHAHVVRLVPDKMDFVEARAWIETHFDEDRCHLAFARLSPDEAGLTPADLAALSAILMAKVMTGQGLDHGVVALGIRQIALSLREELLAADDEAGPPAAA